jgi:3-hydroxyacyl-CoA dehydrogenase/enoyl-CoA hydratase/carnithine racemase
MAGSVAVQRRLDMTKKTPDNAQAESMDGGPGLRDNAQAESMDGGPGLRDNAQAGSLNGGPGLRDNAQAGSLNGGRGLRDNAQAESMDGGRGLRDNAQAESLNGGPGLRDNAQAESMDGGLKPRDNEQTGTRGREAMSQGKQAGHIRSAAVIGAGVMGAGIAAHLANAGMRVLLVDVVPHALTAAEERQGLTLAAPAVRSRLAAAAIANMGRAKPAQLYDPAFAQRITPGNLADHKAELGQVDWIVEAVVERLDIKREVLALIDAVRAPDALVSTNTSGLSAEAMAEGRSEGFRRHFAVTHFFNPPRYMKLVEIVPVADTSPETVALLTEVCQQRLGKGVVQARDTPNFIANRIGTYGMLVTLADTLRFGLSVEEADALTGPAMGRPRTATFRMLDLVGLDTLLHVVDNVRERSADSGERVIFARPVLLEKLVAARHLGEKSGAGFYRKVKGEGGAGSRIESLRLNQEGLVYGPQRTAASATIEAAKAAKGAAAKVKALLRADPRSPHGQFAWSTIKKTLLYSAEQVGIIADSLADIDRAMRWGFNWELGPFELWDAIGLESSVRRMQEEGERVPEWVLAWLAAGNGSFYKVEAERRLYAGYGGAWQPGKRERISGDAGRQEMGGEGEGLEVREELKEQEEREGREGREKQEGRETREGREKQEEKGEKGERKEQGKRDGQEAQEARENLEVRPESEAPEASEASEASEKRKELKVPQGQGNYLAWTVEAAERDAVSLRALKDAGKTVLSNAGASLIDLGDDVVCLEFHSANNAIGGDILTAIQQSVAEVERNWRGLVLANEGRNFCVGANLMLLLMEAQSGEWDEVEEIIRLFQSSMLALKRLERPVVAAPHRMTLGGGVEACLPADQILFAPETYFGLVETGVGLIPAGGGCKEAALLAAERAIVPGSTRQAADVQPYLSALFETIALARTSTSGHEAGRLGLMRPQDRVLLRQESRIAEAKRAVLELDRAGYAPRGEGRIRVAGREGKALLQVAVQAMRLSGQISKHDALIAGKLAHVMAGGDVSPGSVVSEQYLLDLECEAFLSLCGERKTQERMSHMLATGKPLRN